jgi:lathosterol oxidase
MTSVFLFVLGKNTYTSQEKLQNFKIYQKNQIYFKCLFDFTENILINEFLHSLIINIVLSCLVYFSLCLIDYYFFFNIKSSKFLPNYKGKLKILHDIKWSIINILIDSLLLSLLNMLIHRYSLIYYEINDFGLIYFFISIFMHIIFDETLTYWIHRFFHFNKFLYRNFHKIHHDSIDISPFTGFAFHPLDSFAQALPTFISCFFFPLNYNFFVFYSFLSSVWAISIHDNVPLLPIKLFLYSTHHTIHHESGLGKLRNFGKFTSIWDRISGTYADPDKVDFGWVRNQSIFKKINILVEVLIPDKTVNKIKKNPIFAKN